MSGADHSTGPNLFPTTQWTLIIDAIQKGTEPTSQAALAAFCQGYRHAIYGFFRRRGCTHDDAEDLTQGFFASKILEKWNHGEGILQSARRDEQRKFRTFLATRLWWFLKDARAKQRTQRAGGALAHISLEDLGESDEGADSLAAKLVGCDFDRAIAVETITTAVRKATRSKSFLAYFVTEHTGKGMSQEDAAKELGFLNVNTFKKNYHEFRQRLRKELFKEVSRYAGPERREIEAEIKYLIALYAESPP